MPNWCENRVTIYGQSAVLSKLVAQAEKGTHKVRSDWNAEKSEYETITEVANRFSFDNLVPTPEGDSATANDGWYEWRVSNWGTKWDLNQENIRDFERRKSDDPDSQFEEILSFSAPTAWSPPLEFFQRLTEVYPVQVICEYVEEGMNFIGQAQIESGEIADFCRDLTAKDYERAGVPLDEEGVPNWDNFDGDYDLMSVFDYWEEE